MISENEEDESHWYDIYNLNGFSFYLPGWLLSYEMHCDKGVAISIEAGMRYMEALWRLTQSIDGDLKI
jgi:hypothetical protein